MDYNALAKEFGGTSSLKASSIDYGAMAKEFGGTSQPAPVAPVAPAPAKPGYFARVGNDISSGFESIKNNVMQYVNPQSKRDVIANSVGEPILRTAGDVVGMALSPVTEAVKSGVDAAGEALSEHPIVQQIAQLNSVGKGLDKVSTFGQRMAGLAEKYPNIAKDLEAGINVASVIPVGGAAKIAGKELGAVGTDMSTLIAKGTQESIPAEIQGAVRTGIEKAIRPSVAGKANFAAVNKYYEKANDAVSAIITNKEKLNFVDDAGEVVATGVLPKTLNEFSQAVEQTKKSIFEEYDNMVKATMEKDFIAGENGVVTPVSVDLKPIAAELRRGAADPVVRALDPNVATYASKLADNLEAAGTFTAEQVQDAIKQLNARLGSFYAGRSGSSVGKIETDAIIANRLRESLDDLVMTATGEGYQKLKSMYGSLKTIEKDIAHRAVVDARKNNKGLIDFTNIFSYGDIALGLGSGNVAHLSKGLLERGIAAFYKMKNNPNNIVKNMFGDVEGLLEKGKKAAEPFVPKSNLFKGIEELKNRPAGMSIKDVTREAEQLAAGQKMVDESPSARYEKNIQTALKKAKKFLDFEAFRKAYPKVNEAFLKDIFIKSRLQD